MSSEEDPGTSRNADRLAPVIPHCLAIAAGMRWLATQDPRELSGDDAVGWWLLMESGSFPSPQVLESMEARLERIYRGRPVGGGEIYTFTALARTLSRARCPPRDLSGLRKAWTESIGRYEGGSRRVEVDINFLWLVQMGCDLWPETITEDLLTKLSTAPDVRGVFAANAILLAKAFQIDLPKTQVCELERRVGEALKERGLEDLMDWQLAYLARAQLVLNHTRESEEATRLLMKRQTDGSWDGLSEEVVESTSLCGLALVDLAVAKLGIEDPDLARAAVVLRSVLFRDQPIWLRHRLSLVRESTDSGEKGDALETLVQDWVGADPNLKVNRRDMRGGTDELDLVVEVLGGSPLADDIAPTRNFIVECKNTVDPIGSRDVRAFRDSLSSRRMESLRLGVYISHAGFTRDAQELIRENFGQEKVLLLLSAEEIERRLEKRQDLSQALHQMFEDGVLKRP